MSAELDRVLAAKAAVAAAEQELVDAVRAANAAGFSWAAIGGLFGVRAGRLVSAWLVQGALNLRARVTLYRCARVPYLDHRARRVHITRRPS